MILSIFQIQRLATLFVGLWQATQLYAQSTPASKFSDLSAQAAGARDANRLDEAAGLYRTALALKPDWPEGWWSLGTVYYDLNNYREAAAAFTKVSALAAKSGSARVMLGLSEFELGEDTEALKHIQEGERIGVVENEQLRHVALFHEGILLRREGKFEGAQRALDSLCIAGLDNSELLSELGMTAVRIRDRSAPTAAPATAVISGVGHAQCLAARKEFDKAKREYAELCRNYPDFQNLHYAYGRFLLDAHEVPSGIAELETEIELDPNDSYARLEIAAAKYKVDSAGGLPFARAAVEHNPNLPLAHYMLGLLLLDTGNVRQAIPQLEIAQRSMPQVPNVYAALGSAYSQADRDGDAARARAKLQRLNRETTNGGAPQP